MAGCFPFIFLLSQNISLGVKLDVDFDQPLLFAPSCFQKRIEILPKHSRVFFPPYFKEVKCVTYIIIIISDIWILIEIFKNKNILKIEIYNINVGSPQDQVPHVKWKLLNILKHLQTHTKSFYVSFTKDWTNCPPMSIVVTLNSPTNLTRATSFDNVHLTVKFL